MQFALINSVMYVCDINMGYFDKHIIILINIVCVIIFDDFILKIAVY